MEKKGSRKGAFFVVRRVLVWPSVSARHGTAASWRDRPPPSFGYQHCWTDPVPLTLRSPAWVMDSVPHWVSLSRCVPMGAASIV